jgi:branched-chain amino acid transport system permease protein
LLLLHKTSLGKQIRAVSNNPELCNIYGINSDQVILYATALSAALAAIAGILISERDGVCNPSLTFLQCPS